MSWAKTTELVEALFGTRVDIKGQFDATLAYLVQFSRSKFNQGQYVA